jgi:hypothetical protein
MDIAPIKPYKVSWTDEYGKAFYADSARLCLRGTGWVEFSWLPETDEVYCRFISEPDYSNFDYLLNIPPLMGYTMWGPLLIKKKRTINTISNGRTIWKALVACGWST